MLTHELSYKEMLIAAQVGVVRQIENTQKSRKQRYGQASQRSYQDHIIGAMGEMVVSKVLDAWWRGMFDFRGPDILDGVQVRTTDGLGGRRLVLHPEDNNDDIFVHVRTDGLGYFEIVGWLFAKEGKRDEFWLDPKGNNRYAFFVPNSKLRDMKSIVDFLPGRSLRG